MMPESDQNVKTISSHHASQGSRAISAFQDLKENSLNDVNSANSMSLVSSLPALPAKGTSHLRSAIISSPPLVYTVQTTSTTPVISTPKAQDISIEENVVGQHLCKLKRFLTTLQKFSDGISEEVSDQVKRLIADVVTKSLSIEEFNETVSQVTNFPLRPFVIPFLKNSLPYLQRQLNQMAHMMKMTPRQYLYQNEYLVTDGLEPTSRADAHEIFKSELNVNGKRKLTVDRKKDAGYNDGIYSPPKRHQSVRNHNSGQNHRFSPVAPHSSVSPQVFQFEEIPKDLRKERVPVNNSSIPDEHDEDEWKNIYTMLNCILGMVDKTKRALAILHERSCGGTPNDHDKGFSRNSNRSAPVLRDSKKFNRSSESQFPSAFDESICERQAEVLKEIRDQAVMEFRQERLKMEKVLEDARLNVLGTSLAFANKQKESVENCWNCGRKASETCSGCNTARYCGSFCQHKDWENHHLACGKSPASNTAPATSSSPSANVISSSHETVSDEEGEKDKTESHSK